MKLTDVDIGETETLIGAILAHGVVGANGGKIAKGTVLSADHLVSLSQAGHKSLTVALLADGDLDENSAAERLARALTGANIRAASAHTGRVNLYASRDGLCHFSLEAMRAFNAVDPAITCATLPNFSKVSSGQLIATIKIIPFALPTHVCDKAVDAGSVQGLTVSTFQTGLRVGLVQTVLPQTKPSVIDKTSDVTKHRLADLGLSLAHSEKCDHSADALRAALENLCSGHDVVIVFSASAICDIEDIVPRAIVDMGGSVDRFGMPVDPGNLLLLGRSGATQIIGAPGCARSKKLNGFDWVLERICAGLPVSDTDVNEMAIGGLLSEIPSRPSPREVD